MPEEALKSIEKLIVKEKCPDLTEGKMNLSLENNSESVGEKTLVKKSKQATLSSWFDSSLQKEYLTSKIESKKKKKNKTDPKNQSSLDTFFN